MSSAFHLQLLLFTVLGPAGAIGFVLSSAFAIGAPRNAPWLFRLQRCLIIPIFVCMLGLVIAATHLGTPRNALYVLMGVGRSPLSNEMVATIAFLALSWLFWLMLAMRRMPVALAKGWLVVASLAALVMVRETSLAYSIATIPAWNSPAAPWMFWTGACVLGCSLAWCTLLVAKAEVPRLSWWLLLVVQAASVVAGVFAMVQYRASLSEVSTALGDALSLAPHYEGFVWGFAALALLACASGVWGLVSARAKGAAFPRPSSVAASLALATAAVVIMRIPFYLMHMTVGL